MLCGLILIGCGGLLAAVYVTMLGAIRASNDEIEKLRQQLSATKSRLKGCRKLLTAAEAENLELIKKYRNCQPRCAVTGRLIKTKNK